MGRFLPILFLFLFFLTVHRSTSTEKTRLTDGSQPISRIDRQVKLGTVCRKCLEKFCERRLFALPATSRYCCKKIVQDTVDLEVSCSRYQALGEKVVETCHIHKSDWNICVNLVLNDKCKGCNDWIDPTDNVWHPPYCYQEVGAEHQKIATAETVQECLLGICHKTVGNEKVKDVLEEACKARADTTWVPTIEGGCYDENEEKVIGECFDPSGLPVPERDTQAKCQVVGTCSNPLHTTFETCIDTCSVPGLLTEALCIDGKGEWVLEEWTSDYEWRDMNREDHCLAGVCVFYDMQGRPHPLGVADEEGCKAIDATNTWIKTKNKWTPPVQWNMSKCLDPNGEEIKNADTIEKCRGKDLDKLLPVIENHGRVIRKPPDQRSKSSVPIETQSIHGWCYQAMIGMLQSRERMAKGDRVPASVANTDVPV
eukprot:g4307.t1